MTTQFHALRLPQTVTDVVVSLTSQNHIDLNSVCVTPERVIVGELKCGKYVHIHHVREAFGKPEHYNVSLCDTVNNKITNRVRVTL